MIFGTVRRKLTALVAFSAAAALVVVPMLSWLMHKQLIDEVKVRVPSAINGFDEELDDDLKDLDLTANVLAAETDTAAALATRDIKKLTALARPFNGQEIVNNKTVSAYPYIDVVFYGPDGKFIMAVGCEHASPTLPAEVGEGHTLLVGGCETAAHAPVAIAVTRKVGDAGTVLVCLPLDKDYFENSLVKLNKSVVSLALVQDDKVRYSSDKFPVTKIGDITTEIDIVDGDDGATFAMRRFVPRGLADAMQTAKTKLAFYIARDVTSIRSAVRSNLWRALLILGAATLASIALGWRLASRMSRALSRVSHAMRRLEQQEYVKVDVLKTGDELEDLANGFNAMVDGLQERDKLRTTMGKYMTEAVVAHLMAGEVALGGKTLEVSILFCDLRDFTTLSETRKAEEIVALLNEYFTDMVECVMAEGGVVDKYIGDNIMAVFGAPVSRPDDALRAVRAAVHMREALVKLNARFAERGLPTLRFGIGIHTGEVVAGNIGSIKRMEYTVIGDAVNLASRLESKTKELKTDILVSEATYARVTDALDAEQSGDVHVKGREQPVTIYKVKGLLPGAPVPRRSQPVMARPNP
jgi:adenylate cyclase